MSSPAPETREDEILDELAELGLALARKVQARAMAAAEGDDDAALCELSAAFHRVSRTVRQSLALKDRMGRMRRADDRRAGDDAIGGFMARHMLRKGQVRAAVVRTLREGHLHEHEYEPLLDVLDDRIYEASLLDDDFVDGPFDAIVSRIRADLALVAEATGGDGPWRGSG